MKMRIRVLNMVMFSLTSLLKTSLAKISELDQYQVSLMLMRPRMEDRAMSQEPKLQMETKMVKITTTNSLNSNWKIKERP
jgi:hypothetical protein